MSDFDTFNQFVIELCAICIKKKSDAPMDVNQTKMYNTVLHIIPQIRMDVTKDSTVSVSTPVDVSTSKSESDDTPIESQDELIGGVEGESDEPEINTELQEFTEKKLMELKNILASKWIIVEQDNL